MAQPESSTRPTRFRVADVVPATMPAVTETLAKSLPKIIGTKLVVCPTERTEVVPLADFHPLIASAALAFKHHFPLALSPDVLWLTILQGVAQHINNHSSELRARLVRHQTKIELVVDTDLPGLPANDAQMLAVVAAFKERIAPHIPDDKQFLLNAEFSTTNDVARIASCVALMDAMQTYFDYVFNCICGIPAVILEGSTEDWRMVKQKVQALHESDLEISWWTKELLALVDHFVRASQGDVDRQHWGNLCKVIERYGAEDLNGWLLKFIPYVRSGRNQPLTTRNPVLGRADTEAVDENDPYGFTGCTSDQLPNGLSKSPVICVFKSSGLSCRFDFVAGLVGVSQEAETLALRPMIGWAIAEPTPIERMIGKLRTDHMVRPPSGRSPLEIARQFREYLPSDLARFYTETDGAEVDSPVLGFRFDILALHAVQPVCDEAERAWDRKVREMQSALAEMERVKFIRTYGRLMRIANGDDGSAIVCGRLAPAVTLDPQEDEHHDVMRVFRWNGVKEPSAFVPLAKSFSDWLESILGEE